MQRRILCAILFWVCATPVYSQTVDVPTICGQLFGAAYEAGSLGTEAVALGAEAVWGASELNGGNATFNGTLTQQAINKDEWSYAPSPSDRLVVIFTGSPAVTFTFSRFNGYIDGSWEDFVDQHDLDFNVSIGGQLDIHVVSYSIIPGKRGLWQPVGAATTFEWQRQVTGTTLYDGETLTLDLNHTGNKEAEVDGGFASSQVSDTFTGTAQTPALALTFSQSAWTYIIHNSNTATHARNAQLVNNSSAVVGGVTYRFQDAFAAWATGSALNDPGLFNVVIDTNYWDARGILLRDGAVIGNVLFDGPVIGNASAPRLVVHLNGGESVVVRTLADGQATPIEAAPELAERAVLHQSYPNPFGAETTIVYDLNAPGGVRLAVYDLFGREVALLQDGLQTTGRHTVRFDAEGLAVGTYFYRLDTGGAFVTRPMLLVR